MDYNDFVMRAPNRKRVLAVSMFLLVVSIIVALYFLYRSLFAFSPEETLLFNLISLMIGTGYLLNLVLTISWKYTIQGNEISYKSLFRRKLFTFSDIVRVEVIRAQIRPRWFGRSLPRIFQEQDEEKKRRIVVLPAPTNSGRRVLLLYAKTEKLPIISEGIANYDLFLQCLKRRNIPGARDL